MSARSWRAGLGLALLLLSLIAAALVVPGPAEALVGRDRAAAQEEAPPGLWQKTILTARQWQIEMQRKLTASARAIKAAPSWVSVAALLAIGFVYGVLHAAGPGHGKIVVASYLIATRSQMRRGLQLAFLSSMAQAVSAIVLVGVLFMLLDLPRLEASSKTRILEMVSYGLIAGLGVWMFVRALRGQSCGHDHGHEQSHDHSPHDHSLPMQGIRGLRDLLGPILAIGIRPCTGAVIILLFTLAQGILLAGIGATFAMAFGTALTVGVLAVVTVTSRRAAMRLAGTNTIWVDRAHMALAVLGACAISAFGVIMLIASLGQRGPAF